MREFVLTCDVCGKVERGDFRTTAMWFSQADYRRTIHDQNGVPLNFYDICPDCIVKAQLVWPSGKSLPLVPMTETVSV